MADEQLNILVRLKDFASAQFSKLNSTVKGFGTGALGAFKSVTGAVFSLKGALAGLGVTLGTRALLNLSKDLVSTAGALESTSIGFENLTRKIGGSERVLAALRKGTRDTIGDLELFKAANNAILLDVARSPQEFEKLTTVARRLGRAVGRDTLDAFNDLSIGIGRQSRLFLDNLGIIVSVEKANEEYAKSLGKTVDQLTQAESRQAFLNATLTAADKRVAELGEDTLTLSDEFGRLKAEIANVSNEVLTSLGPAFTETTRDLADWIKQNKPAILNFFAEIIEGAGRLATIIGQTFEVIRDTINFTQRTINEFKLGAAVEEVQDLEEALRLAQGRAAQFNRVGSAPFQEQAKKYREEIEKISPELEKARKELKSLEQANLDLVKSQSKQDPLVTGDTERRAKAAADALRGVAKAKEEVLRVERFGPDQNPFAVLERSLKTVITLTQDAAIAQDKADQEYLDGAEARSDAASERIAAAFEELDAEQKLNDLAAERSKFIKEQIAEEGALAEARRQTRLETDQNAAAILAERDAAFGAAEAFQRLRLDSEKFGQAANDAILGVADSLTNNLTDGILAVVEGQKDLKEASRDAAKQILADIARIIIQTLVLKAVQGSLGGIGGAIGFARGGVTPGPLVPVRGLASGDVIQPPGGTFRVAEAGRPEAVLPLMRNSRGDLGVQTVGGEGAGSSRVQNLYLTVNYNGTVTGEKALLQRNAETIQQLVAAKLTTSATYREQLRAA